MQNAPLFRLEWIANLRMEHVITSLSICFAVFGLFYAMYILVTKARSMRGQTSKMELTARLHLKTIRSVIFKAFFTVFLLAIFAYLSIFLGTYMVLGGNWGLANITNIHAIYFTLAGMFLKADLPNIAYKMADISAFFNANMLYNNVLENSKYYFKLNWIACGLFLLCFFLIIRFYTLRKFFKREIKTVEMEDGQCKKVENKSGNIKVTFAETKLTPRIETKHLLAVGTTGAGKTQCIQKVIEDALKREDSVVCFDNAGEFLSKFYNQNADLILNPYDKRSVKWSPLAEIRGSWDCESIAKALIPDGTGESNEWNKKAQTILRVVLQYLMQYNATNKDMLDILLRSTREEIATVVKGTDAAPLVDTAEQFDDVRGIISQYLASFNNLHPNATKNDFSIRGWLEKTDTIQKRRALWVTFRDDMFDSLRPLLTAIASCAVKGTLSLEPSKKRRVWLIMDEFGELKKIESIQSALTRGRKYGLRVLAGVQTISQMLAEYGRHNAQTLLANFNTTLFLRVVDAETAEFCSKTIGDREQVTKSKSYNKEGTNISEQRQVKRALLPHIFNELPDLSGILKIGEHPYAKIKLKIRTYKQQATPFLIFEPNNAATTTSPEAPEQPEPQPDPQPEPAAQVSEPQPEDEATNAEKVEKLVGANKAAYLPDPEEEVEMEPEAEVEVEIEKKKEVSKSDFD